MDFTFSSEDETFRDDVRSWLATHLVGAFAEIGDGYDLTHMADTRAEWERELGRGRWIGLSWPSAYGGRDLSLTQQLIFGEEYARAGAPQRAFFGEGLL